MDLTAEGDFRHDCSLLLCKLDVIHDTHMKGGATVHGMIWGFSPDMLEMLLLPSVASGRWEFMLEKGPQLA